MLIWRKNLYICITVPKTDEIAQIVNCLNQLVASFICMHFGSAGWGHFYQSPPAAAAGKMVWWEHTDPDIQ